MEQQPDKLFRQKLENHQLAAPASAWDKIDGSLRKNKKDYRWLMAAATLLLVAIATVLMIDFQDDITPSKNTASEKPVIQKPAKPTNNSIVIEAPDVNPAPAKQSSENKLRVPAKKYSAPEIAEVFTTDDSQPGNNIAREEVIEKAIVIEEIKIEELQDNPVTAQPETAVATTGNFKLVLEADEVNKKYLEQYSSADATTSEKKSSTLKRILNKVQSLKNNQDPFGELREKKNEILALNFKNEKRPK